MPYADPVKRKEYLKMYCKANAEKARKRTADWRRASPERAHQAVLNSRRAKPEKYRAMLAAQAMKRKAQKIKAIPAWANISKIRKLYELALTSNSHVDHIVPLLSKFVCGLHCESNLQIIPGPENISKGNRFWPNMWD